MKRLIVMAGVLIAVLAAAVTGRAQERPAIVLQSKHAGFVASAAFLDRGRLLATAGDEIDIWDVRSRLKIRTIKPLHHGSQRTISAVAADVDGTLLFAGDRNAGTLFVYDVRNGGLQQEIASFGSGINDLALSGDGRRLLVAQFGTISEFSVDPSAAEPLRSIRSIVVAQNESVRKARYAAGSSRIVVIAGKEIVVIDVTTGLLQRLPTRDERLYALAASPTRPIFLTAGASADDHRHHMQVWDLRTGRASGDIDLARQCWHDAERSAHCADIAFVNELIFSKDGDVVAAAGQLSGEGLSTLSAGIFHVPSGRQLRTYGGHAHPGETVRFDPSGRLLVSLSMGNLRGDSRVLLHDVAAEPPIAELGQGIEEIRDVSVRPDKGGAVVVAGDKAAYVLDIARGLRRTALRVPDMGWIGAVEWSPTGQVYVQEQVTNERATHLFDPSGRRLGGIVASPGEQKYAYELPERAAFHPDGRRIALGMRDGRVELRRLSDSKLLAVLPGIPNVASGIAAPSRGLLFSRDGKRLFVSAGMNTLDGSGSGSVRAFDVDTGKLQRELDTGPQIGPIAASPEGERFVSGGQTDRIRIYERSTGDLIGACEPHGQQFSVSSLTFAPDGRYVIAGMQNGIIRVWDAATGKFVREQVIHDDRVRALAADPVTRTVISASPDGTMKIHAVAPDGELTTRLTVVSTGPDEFVGYTPDGYYRTTAGGSRAVAFRIGERIVPFEQFDLRYNRPDKVVSALGEAADPVLLAALTDAYDRRLRRIGLPTQATSMLDGPPMEAALANLPELNVESDVTASTTASTTIRVSVAAKAASGAQLASLRVFVNDVPALAAIDRASSPSSPSVDGFRLSAPRFSARLGIRLSTVFGGRNQITLSAVDSLGRESLIERLEVTTTSKPAHDPVRYVVAIGVSQYRDGRYNLDYASADARSIGALFDHPQSTTWSGHTKTLILQDEEVTRDLIRKVRDFLAPAAIDDMVILFVASHGTIDSNGTFWIATHDMDFERPESRAIDYDTLEDLLAHVPARQKLLLIDTCQSGEGDGAAESAVAAPPTDSGVRVRALVSKAAAQKQPSPIVLEDFFANLSRGSGAQVLVAAAANELAIEKEGHGLFTQSVLEAIGQRKAATKSYGPISFSELAAYVVPRVIQASGGQQTPTVRRGRPEFDFAVD